MYQEVLLSDKTLKIIDGMGSEYSEEKLSQIKLYLTDYKKRHKSDYDVTRAIFLNTLNEAVSIGALRSSILSIKGEYIEDADKVVEFAQKWCSGIKEIIHFPTTRDVRDWKMTDGLNLRFEMLSARLYRTIWYADFYGSNDCFTIDIPSVYECKKILDCSDDYENIEYIDTNIIDIMSDKFEKHGDFDFQTYHNM